MERTMQIENENTFRAAIGKQVNLFLGAGFSTLAQDNEGNDLPLGGELAKELRAAFELEELVSVDLPQLCTIISASRADELRQFLVDRFTVGSFSTKYKALCRLDISTIFTTNIDNLIHSIFADSKRYYINDANVNGPVYKDRFGIDFYMLHGSVLDTQRPLRFGAIEVASSFGADPDRWRFLQTRIAAAPTIFMGYSFADAATLETITIHVKKTGRFSESWILVRPTSRGPGAAELFRALNLQVIDGNIEEILQFFEDELSASGPSPTITLQQKTSDLFPRYAIPDPFLVPKSSILDFFRGGAPAWCHVYSGSLHRTVHYYGARDAIFSGSDTILTGAPGTGKTTILMQLGGGNRLSRTQVDIRRPIETGSSFSNKKISWPESPYTNRQF